MISKWDIISSLNSKDTSILYTLLTDGNKQDARLITKKLKGYVKKPKPAAAPYVYRFALPADLDEKTLEKIRQAVREVAEQTKKVDKFAPGGTLENPLFQTDNKSTESVPFSSIKIDPEDSFLISNPALETSQKKSAHPSAKKADQEEADLTDELQDLTSSPTPPAPDMDLQEPSISEKDLNPADVSAEFPLDDQDMLHEEMEDTVLGKKAPIVENILAAETKYDMFVDVSQLVSPAKAATLSSADSTEENDGFNVFDQKIKDQTAFIDVNDISGITGRIAQKDLSFVQHTKVHFKTIPPIKEPESPLPDVSILHTQVDSSQQDEALDPFEALLNSAEKKNTAGQEAPASTTPQEPTQEPSQKPAQTINMKLSQQSVSKASAETKPLLSTENEIMSENREESKSFLHLKRKSATPQVPQPPKPPAPVPAAPKAPAAPSAPAPLPPVPQEEKHHTILRKHPTAKTILEKTRTLDHSIEIPFSEFKKNNWPLEVPLVPTYTLENMTLSVNRFAHATAISVIDNPGKLYNPLVLHGASGTGKTHFLHAIGYALSKKYGQENVFITNGVRLSRGIQRYIMEGNIEKFEAFTSSIKALLIDDIHLISINEKNRAYLSKLLNDFRAQQKQIIITSKYPPENLAKLEELLKFKLDSGWISELKQASGTPRLRIIQRMLTSNGINITNEDVDRFFGQSNMSLGTVVRSVRRVRVLEKLIFPGVSTENRSALSIFDQLLATKGEDHSSQIYQKTPQEIENASIFGNKEWGRIGIFYPQVHSNMMNWLIFAIQQRAKELGISGGPDLVIRSSYTTDNIISSAFKIANLCDNKNLKGAIILGPGIDECDPSVRENFYDILTHMLEIMLIRCGIINLEEASSPSTYVKILAELLR